MHDKHTEFPGVRLAVAGCLCLALLLWVGFCDDSWQNALTRLMSSHRQGADHSMALITGCLSLLIFTILSPIGYWGSRTDRWLAALLATVPACVILLTALSLL